MKYINIEKIKEFLMRISDKKRVIEDTYFQSLNVFNDMLSNNSDNVSIINEVSIRKEKLDDSVNQTISYLDNMTAMLSSVLEKITNDENFLKSQEQEHELISSHLSSSDLTIENEYQKELRNIPPQKSLEYDPVDNSAEEYSRVSSEFNDFLDQVNKEFEYFSPNEVKQGLLNDQEYSFSDRITNLEESLKREMEVIASHNAMIDEQTQNLQNAINKLEERGNFGLSSLYNKRTWDDSELYFSALDKSVNTAVEKFDAASEKMTNAINTLSISQIENLEKISLPLIKSLEATLKTMSSDFSDMKKEYDVCKKELEKYKDLVDNLKNENYLKDHELKTSYDSWMSNVRKISELEGVLNDQSDDIKKIYEEKNDLINRLEEKISETGNFINQIVYEKEVLIQQNSDLFKELHYLKKEISGENFFDDYIKTVSIQDIVEKEADKIVELKIENLVKKYQSEIDQIKAESISYFMNVKDNDERVFEKLLSEKNESEDSEIFDVVKSLDKKLENLEKKLEYEKQIKEKTEDTINDLNLLLGEGPYSMVEQEKAFLTNKFDLLEQKIEESLERVKNLEDSKYDSKDNELVIDEEELNDMFSQSPLYEDINQQLLGKELEIDTLKSENLRIQEENAVINSVLDETFKKITINSSKIKEIEELLTKQDYEFMMLNEEKNNVIDSLYKAIKNRDLAPIDDISGLNKLNKYDFSNFAKNSLNENVYQENLLDYIKQEVEKLVSNEIDYLRKQYEDELNIINEKYEYAKGDILKNQTQINSPTNYKKIVKKYYPVVPELDSKLFDIGDNSELREELQNYLLDDKTQLESYEELIEEKVDDNNNEVNYEFIGEGENLLDVTLLDDDDLIDKNKPALLTTKIIHEVTTNKREESLIKKLSARNDELENKIRDLEKIITNKFNEEIQKSKDFIEQNYYEEIVPEVSQENQNIYENVYITDIKNDLLHQQTLQNQEIDRKIRDSISELQQRNDREFDNLNKKIDSITKTNNNIYISDSTTSVFDNQILEDKSLLYLEREIIDSTDKLLKIQRELLSLETEIINEEKNIIVEL